MGKGCKGDARSAEKRRVRGRNRPYTLPCASIEPGRSCNGEVEV